jgi:hypothetical protein
METITPPITATPLPTVSGMTEDRAKAANAALEFGKIYSTHKDKLTAMDEVTDKLAGGAVLSITGIKLPSKERAFKKVVLMLLQSYPSFHGQIKDAAVRVASAIVNDKTGDHAELIEMISPSPKAKAEPAAEAQPPEFVPDTVASPVPVGSATPDSSGNQPQSGDPAQAEIFGEPPVKKRRSKKQGGPAEFGIEIQKFEPKPVESVPPISHDPSNPMSGMITAVANALLPSITQIATNQARHEIADAVGKPLESITNAVKTLSLESGSKSSSSVSEEVVKAIVEKEMSGEAGKGIKSIIESGGVSILSGLLDKASDAIIAAGPKHDPASSKLNAPVPDADPFYYWDPELLKAVDLIHKASMRQPQNTLIVGPTGSGKCLARGTLVLTYCGDAVPVESIKVGDRIMGPSGSPREVTSLARGTERMYRITPIKGESYVVNESHILSLRNTSTGLIVNISVSDYIKKSNTFKHMHKGWRSPVDFNNEFSDVHPDLPPYILGLWLGDGKTNGSSFVVYKPDPEVREQLEKYAQLLGMKLKEWSIDEGDCPQLAITNGWSGKSSRALDALRSVGVLGNKHVPRGYKCASRENRAEILAGLIDSDGSVSNNGYEYSSVIINLAEDVCFIARSLGLAAYKSSKIVNGTTYYRVSISGETSIIPCRIARKKAGTRKQIKDVLNVGISVECIGDGEYFGFTLADDGTKFSRLFLLGDFTVTHNTDFVEQFAAKTGRRFLKMDCANLREPREWFGIKGAAAGATYFRKSQFWHAVQTGGCAILLDEFNRAPDNVRNPLMPLFDHTRRSFVEELGEELSVGNGTCFFATQNEGLEYTGTHATDRAMKSRFVRRIEVDYLPQQHEEKVLIDKAGVSKDDAKKLVEIAATIRGKASALSGGLSDTVSTRQLIQAAMDFTIGGVSSFKHTIFSHFSSDGGVNSDRAQVVNMFQLKGFKL